MKFSKAYILLKTRVGTEDAFFDRLTELDMAYHACYRLFGQYDLLIELLFTDWEDLDGFMFNLQKDAQLKEYLLEEIRLISHDGSFNAGGSTKGSVG
ncbi:hypothetical protein GF325_16480 [Candidatus Bathyarchaeota archaeon]|nr:hypothetical protein [Candidatus Bathyarchaeota archaeon]